MAKIEYFSYIDTKNTRRITVSSAFDPDQAKTKPKRVLIPSSLCNNAASMCNYVKEKYNA